MMGKGVVLVGAAERRAGKTQGFAGGTEHFFSHLFL